MKGRGAIALALLPSRSHIDRSQARFANAIASLHAYLIFRDNFRKWSLGYGC